MIRVLLGAFIVAHGLVTAVIWVMPTNAEAPFRTTHSWLVGDARPLAVVVIALVAAVGFVLAGIGFVTQQAWWAFTGIGAGALLLLLTLYFNPGSWPASPSAPGSSTQASEPCRRPSGTEERSQ